MFKCAQENFGLDEAIIQIDLRKFYTESKLNGTFLILHRNGKVDVTRGQVKQMVWML